LDTNELRTPVNFKTNLLYTFMNLNRTKIYQNMAILLRLLEIICSILLYLFSSIGMSMSIFGPLIQVKKSLHHLSDNNTVADN
jgi:hypothetical protein